MKRPAAEAEMKPILLIRPDNNQSDADALAEAGIASVTEPLLEIVPAPDPGPGRALARLLGEANSVTWLVVIPPLLGATTVTNRGVVPPSAVTRPPVMVAAERGA